MQKINETQVWSGFTTEIARTSSESCGSSFNAIATTHLARSQPRSSPVGQTSSAIATTGVARNQPRSTKSQIADTACWKHTLTNKQCSSNMAKKLGAGG